jgi:hypothetical protein
VKVAEALVDLVGEAKVKAAYFAGGQAIPDLIKAVDDKRGAGTFAKVKQLGDARNFSGARDALSATGHG